MSAEGTSDSPGAGWAILRTSGETAGDFEIATVRCETITPDGPVRFALGSRGEARMLLPLPERSGPLGNIGAPALGVSVSSFAGSAGRTRFLDLTCLSNDLEGVFAEVSGQILFRIRTGAGSRDAACSTIEDFRALLVRPPSQEVAVHEIAGLVGELLYLNRLLDRHPEGWRAWRGPAGDRHDFRNADLSVEVKSSLRKGGSSVTINGIHQLEVPAGGSLFLQHFELEHVAGGILSVRGLGTAALAKASDPAGLLALLAAVECPAVEAEVWNSASFRQEGETLFRIEAGFPRLVPSLFVEGLAPAGVSDVSYAIDLTTAASFAVLPDAAGEIEEGLISCL